MTTAAGCGSFGPFLEFVAKSYYEKSIKTLLTKWKDQTQQQKNTAHAHKTCLEAAAWFMIYSSEGPFKDDFWFSSSSSSSAINKSSGCLLIVFYYVAPFSICSAHVMQMERWQVFLWLSLPSSLFSVLTEGRYPSGLYMDVIKMCGCDKKSLRKVYKPRQHETVMFNLCLCLSTFNDVLGSSVGRKKKKHIFHANEETNTNKYASLVDHHVSHRTSHPDYSDVWANMPSSSLFIPFFF